MALRKNFFLSLFANLLVQVVAPGPGPGQGDNYDCFGHDCHHDSICRIEYLSINLLGGSPYTSGKCQRHNDHHHDHVHVQPCDDIIGHLPTNDPLATTICDCDNAECIDRFLKATEVTHPPKVHVTHPTTTPTTTVPTTAEWCIDTDPKCSDPSYQQYICPSTDLAARSFNIEFCPKACNLCTEYLERFLKATKVTHATHLTTTLTPKTTTVATTAAASTTRTVPTTAEWCIDTDPKCSDPSYQQFLCPSTDLTARSFNIEFCPKACNLCTEYLAFLQTRTTNQPSTPNVAKGGFGK